MLQLQGSHLQASKSSATVQRSASAEAFGKASRPPCLCHGPKGLIWTAGSRRRPHQPGNAPYGVRSRHAPLGMLRLLLYPRYH